MSTLFQEYRYSIYLVRVVVVVVVVVVMSFFLKVFEVSARFFQRAGPASMCLDAFGCNRTRLDALGCIWAFSKI